MRRSVVSNAAAPMMNPFVRVERSANVGQCSFDGAPRSICAICRSAGSGAARQTDATNRKCVSTSHDPSGSCFSVASSMTSPVVFALAGMSTM